MSTQVYISGFWDFDHGGLYLVDLLILLHRDLPELLPHRHSVAVVVLQLPEEVSGSLPYVLVVLRFLVYLDIDLQDANTTFTANTVTVTLHKTDLLNRSKSVTIQWISFYLLATKLTSNKCCRGFSFNFCWQPNRSKPAPSKPVIQIKAIRKKSLHTKELGILRETRDLFNIIMSVLFTHQTACPNLPDSSCE